MTGCWLFPPRLPCCWLRSESLDDWFRPKNAPNPPNCARSSAVWAPTKRNKVKPHRSRRSFIAQPLCQRNVAQVGSQTCVALPATMNLGVQWQHVRSPLSQGRRLRRLLFVQVVNVASIGCWRGQIQNAPPCPQGLPTRTTLPACVVGYCTEIVKAARDDSRRLPAAALAGGGGTWRSVKPGQCRQ